jgi:cytochrome c oxidase subunit 3
MTEILLFGGLFLAYTVFRTLNTDMFHNAHKHLNLTLGTVNTIVLITSSVTMALAIRFMQVGRKNQTLLFLFFTFSLALAFLVIKYFEYSHKIHLGQLPGRFYTYTGIEGTNPHIFFSVYFTMTGLHALHIIGGMAAITMMFIRTVRNHFSPEYYTPIELTGLYWHLVDLIWIYLFPLLYLVG